jgi:AraC-like DNA-binding protein
MIQYERAQLIVYCKEDHIAPVERYMEEDKLCHILSGSLEVVHEGEARLLKTGATIFFRRNQLVRASLVPDENGPPFACSKIVLSRAFLQQMYPVKKPVQKEQNTVPGISGNKLYVADNDELARAFFQSQHPYLNPKNTISHELSLHKTKEMLMILEHLWPGIEQPLFDLSDPGKADISDFMQKNYSFNLPLSQFAYLTGRSLTTFKRDFIKAFGQSPHKWIMQRRLDEALFLIQKKQYTPSDVYIQVGFESLAHFSTAFKKNFGVSPSSLTVK